MPEKDSIQKILEDAKNLVAFHQSLGIDNYPLTDTLRKILSAPTPKRKLVNSTPKRVYSPAPKPAAQAKSQLAPPLKASMTMAEIRDELKDCRRCVLHKDRNSILFGSGHLNADLMIIGEWPDAADDAAGELFSSEAGEMLDKMLLHVLKLSRNEVFIASVLKCKVPDTSRPTPQEITTCKPFILNQIASVNPKVICAMGQTAAQTLLKTNKPLIRLRGRIHDFDGIRLIPTFHPSFLLKNPEMKKATLVDLQIIFKELNNS